MADPTNEERYGPSCKHCGNHLCDCRASADDKIRRLRAALQFYAAKETWEYPGHHHEDAPSHEDQGKRAREALRLRS